MNKPVARDPEMLQRSRVFLAGRQGHPGTSYAEDVADFAAAEVARASAGLPAAGRPTYVKVTGRVEGVPQGEDRFVIDWSVEGAPMVRTDSGRVVTLIPGQWEPAPAPAGFDEAKCRAEFSAKWDTLPDSLSLRSAAETLYLAASRTAHAATTALRAAAMNAHAALGRILYPTSEPTVQRAAAGADPEPSPSTAGQSGVGSISPPPAPSLAALREAWKDVDERWLRAKSGSDEHARLLVERHAAAQALTSALSKAGVA